MRALTGAASRFRTLKLWGQGQAAKDRGRQLEAYSYWDDTPEVRFSGIWVGRAMSKARLFAGLRMPDGEIVEAPEGHPAVGLVTGMAGGPTGQSQLLEQFGPHLVLAGEAYVIVVPDAEKDTEEWFVVSVAAITTRGNKMTARVTVDGEERAIDVPPGGREGGPEDPLGIRIWNPHPRQHSRADSPVMSSFTILDELRLLNASVAAIAKSRLAGRGVLTIPEGAKLPEGDDVMERLLDIAELAYNDPSSAAAVVPILLEVPRGDHSKPELIKFESSFDELALKLREEAIRRYATSSDTPAEVLLGQADINHWGVWAMRDEAIEVGVEPRLATVCDGLTTQWLHPALEAMNVGDWRQAVVWYDTAGLRVRTNRSQTAIELGKDGFIVPKAVRREAGFDDEDAPSKASSRLRLYLNAVNTAPTIIDSVAPRIVELLQEVDKEMEEEDQPSSEQGNGKIELPVDETHEPPAAPPSDTVPPVEPADAPPAQVLAAALDALVVRALERAGHRLRSSRGREDWSLLKNIPACAYHTVLTPTLTEIQGARLLEGAWDRVPELATRYEVREDCLMELLESYARDLLLTGTPHVYEAIPRMVEEASCLQPA